MKFKVLLRNNGTPTRYFLDENDLDGLASGYGWERIADPDRKNAWMVSYRRHDCRLNFWLTTGTCGSYLDHPKQGKTQLFRRKIEPNEAIAIFQNPRVHTPKGYQTKKNSNSHVHKIEKDNDANNGYFEEQKYEAGARSKRGRGRNRMEDSDEDVSFMGEDDEDEEEDLRPTKKSKISCKHGVHCRDDSCPFEHRCR